MSCRYCLATVPEMVQEALVDWHCRCCCHYCQATVMALVAWASKRFRLDAAVTNLNLHCRYFRYCRAN